MKIKNKWKSKDMKEFHRYSKSGKVLFNAHLFFHNVNTTDDLVVLKRAKKDFADFYNKMLDSFYEK